MEDYLATITNELKENNKKLKQENQTLREEILSLNEQIKALNNDDYVQELESIIDTLRVELDSKRASQEKLKTDIKYLSTKFDDFIELFAEYIDEDDTNSYDIGDDKSLIFGVNIDPKFISSATQKALKNYLAILRCNNIQSFMIDDFKPTQKNDIILIGEVFADYVRLSNITNKDKVYGLVKMSVNDSAIQIKFYGNRDIESNFEKFKKIYSKELNLSEAILQD